MLDREWEESWRNRMSCLEEEAQLALNALTHLAKVGYFGDTHAGTRAALDHLSIPQIHNSTIPLLHIFTLLCFTRFRFCAGVGNSQTCC